VVGRDPATDLVVLTVPGGSAPMAGRADAAWARVGSLVLALGRPGRHVTASFGIVSAINHDWRTWHGTRVDRLWRLDLAIYDGFSGGPLIDTTGRVLGLNNSALAGGTPMSLPADTVDVIVDELVQRGHVRRPFIGIGVQPVALPSTLVRAHGLSHEQALLVLSVADGSPAEAAGVNVGDVLCEANGSPLLRPTDLLDAIGGSSAGSALELRLLSGGASKTLRVTPGERGSQR
jgi:S1-C subfamily serine protease